MEKRQAQQGRDGLMQNTIPKYILKNEEKMKPSSQVQEMTIGKKVKVRIGS